MSRYSQVGRNHSPTMVSFIEPVIGRLRYDLILVAPSPPFKGGRPTPIVVRLNYVGILQPLTLTRSRPTPIVRATAYKDGMWDVEVESMVLTMHSSRAINLHHVLRIASLYAAAFTHQPLSAVDASALQLYYEALQDQFDKSRAQQAAKHNADGFEWPCCYITLHYKRMKDAFLPFPHNHI